MNLKDYYVIYHEYSNSVSNELFESQELAAIACIEVTKVFNEKIIKFSPQKINHKPRVMLLEDAISKLTENAYNEGRHDEYFDKGYNY
jgi:hypothetical protein